MHLDSFAYEGNMARKELNEALQGYNQLILSPERLLDRKEFNYVREQVALSRKGVEKWRSDMDQVYTRFMNKVKAVDVPVHELDPQISILNSAISEQRDFDKKLTGLVDKQSQCTLEVIDLLEESEWQWEPELGTILFELDADNDRFNDIYERSSQHGEEFMILVRELGGKEAVDAVLERVAQSR